MQPVRSAQFLPLLQMIQYDGPVLDRVHCGKVTIAVLSEESTGTGSFREELKEETGEEMEYLRRGQGSEYPTRRTFKCSVRSCGNRILAPTRSSTLDPETLDPGDSGPGDSGPRDSGPRETLDPEPSRAWTLDPATSLMSQPDAGRRRRGSWSVGAPLERPTRASEQVSSSSTRGRAVTSEPWRSSSRGQDPMGRIPSDVSFCGLPTITTAALVL
ncbi:unnamed protein product [Gadus morhua 'NCC']